MKISVEILTLTSIKRENSVDKLFLLVFNDKFFNILKLGVLNVKRCKIIYQDYNCYQNKLYIYFYQILYLDFLNLNTLYYLN